MGRALKIYTQLKVQELPQKVTQGKVKKAPGHILLKVQVTSHFIINLLFILLF